MNAVEVLREISAQVRVCQACTLHHSRKNGVPGEGSPQAEIMFIGEGPGFHEHELGRPFVGPAGKFLDELLAEAGYVREQVFIANVVKCRPPGNRTPEPGEIQTCSPFLFRQLQTIAPRVICALGACAAQTLLATTKAISSLRGRPLNWRGTTLVCTFHPAYLLRNPAQKASSWQDLLVIQRILHDDKEVYDHES